MGWQRFTEKIRNSILLGQQEAARMGCPYVSTEHLLLGLMQMDSLGARVLDGLGLSVDTVRREIEKERGPSDPTIAVHESDSVTQLTPALEHIYTVAAQESQLMQLDYVGTEHLLLALAREEDGLAAQVLGRHGVNYEMIRTQVIGQLKIGGDAHNG